MKLLTNNETATLLGLKNNSLEIWRLQGKGPKFIKIGRLVRYAEAEIYAWIEAQTRTSTSQKTPTLPTQSSDLSGGAQ